MKKLINIYLDDVRNTPDGYSRCYTAWECIELLKNNKCIALSLDHDLGDDSKFGTGYDVLVWLEEQVALNKFEPPSVIYVHSDNVVAKPKMLKTIKKIYELV